MKKTLLMPLLALGLAASLPTWACQGCDTHAAAAPTTTPTADAMTVVRDADSGKLRAATAAEIATMLQAQPQSRSTVAGQRRTTATMLGRRHADGATSTRMTDEMISYAVVTRQADGSLAHQCLDDSHAAEGAVHQHQHQHQHQHTKPAVTASQTVVQPATLQLK